jgi:predicted nuclease of restriction endonuclease-like (RecB) superfamily
MTALSTELFSSICQVLDQAHLHLQRTVNVTIVQTYWSIGKLIVEHEQKGENRAEYGAGQLQQLAEKLTAAYGKSFIERNLRYMRTFYLAYPIWNAVRSELTWTHYRILLRVENQVARDWYLNQSIEQNWSSRALDRQIGALYYERLLSSRDNKPVKEEAKMYIDELTANPRDYIRDPYLLDFLNLPYSPALESNLEQGLMDNLQKFLLELGKGFSFVARQQRITLDDQDFFIDLVFYNFKLKFFLLIDLKLGKLTHQDIGQMDTYVRIYDQHERGHDDNPTIGLVLCSEKSEAIAKYSVLNESKQLFASKYLTYLPSEEELRRELMSGRNIISKLPDGSS